jgi:TonB family protein
MKRPAPPPQLTTAPTPGPGLRASGLRSRRGQLRRFVLAAILAVVCHAGTLLYLGLSGVFDGQSLGALPPLMEAALGREAPSDAPLEITQLDVPDERTEAERKREEEAQKEMEKKDVNGQVVDIARPAIEQRPDEARFLSEYDSKVARETKGAVGTGKAGAVVPGQVEPQPPTPPAPSKRPPTPLPSSSQPSQQPLVVKGPVGSKVPGPRGSNEAVESVGPDGTLAHQHGQGELKPGESMGGGALPGGAPKLNLQPSQRALQQALGEGEGSPDYLGDIDEGDATGLNSKKWKFAAFFNRMKALVRDEWHPDQLLSRHDPTGNIYGNKDRVTVLKVELKLDGRVQEVSVHKGSGVEFLDEEAQSAFRRAQPFENPPQALAEPDGVIRFKFAFIVQLSGRTSFKVYKYDR